MKMKMETTKNGERAMPLPLNHDMVEWLGLDLDRIPAYRPELKGAIESAFATLNGPYRVVLVPMAYKRGASKCAR